MIDKDSFKFGSYIPRRASINSKKAYICGVKGSGKTYLASMQADSAKILYIDLNVCITKKSIKNAKEKILNESNNINLIIIDGYFKGFIDSDLLAFIGDRQLICIGSYADYRLDSILANFSLLKLYNLSFDELLGGNTNNASVESLLASFIENGNTPQIYFINKAQREKRKWEIMQLSLRDDFPIFHAMLSFQSMKISISSLYSKLKSRIQVSKDRLYPLINSLRDENKIFLCPHENNESSPYKKYKLYFYDFSLSHFADDKHFLRIYENMVYLELLSLGFYLVYDNNFDFIDRDKGVAFLCMPFASIEHINARINNSKLMDKSKTKLIVISMNINADLENGISIIDFTSLYLLNG